jgi:ribosomal-protein-alanine N-acetyltransferase
VFSGANGRLRPLTPYSLSLTPFTTNYGFTSYQLFPIFAPTTNMNLIHTRRLTLRPLALSDAAFILELLNTKDWIQYIGDRDVRNMDGARNYISSGPQASYETYGHGLMCVVLNAGEVPLGICGLIKREWLPTPDIGFAFLPQFYGKGYALEAANAIMENAASDLHIKKIAAITSPENIRSIKLLEKIGLGFEKMVHTPGDEEPLMLFSTTIS